MNKIIGICSFFCIFGLFSGLAQNPFFTPISAVTNQHNDSNFDYLSKYQVVQLDNSALLQFLLNNVPSENSGQSIQISLPMLDGTFRDFTISESKVMEQELQDKYPSLRTYKGYNGDYSIRMKISTYGFHAIMLGAHEEVIIEKDNSKKDIYKIYSSRDIHLGKENSTFICGLNDHNSSSHQLHDSKSESIAQARAGGAPVNLKKYRLALACTGEWGSRTDLGGGTVASGLDKMVESVNLLNSIYERDFGAHLDLVATNERIIYTNAVSDPYGPGISTTGGAVIPMNTDHLNRVIGFANYDIGHVFTIGCTDVGGVAYLASLCNSGNKGGAITCWYTSDLQYVVQRIFCHEMGHQFSASHTFSNCNGNESGGTAFEPGSGTSIMSYNGLCGQGLNVPLPSGQAHPNFFHGASIIQARNLTRNALTCGATENPNNTAPIAEVLSPSDVYIPILTPFELKGIATDMEDQNTLTYGWEQFDAGSYGPALGLPSLGVEGPLFKVNFPSNDPTRVLPNWTSILNSNKRDITEMLPQVSRNLNWKFVVRDNHPGAGGVATVDYKFKATAEAGPFEIIFPNASSDILYKNTCNMIKWNVANTDKAPVNCSKVKILLFRNRDVKNPIVLKESTDNDGSELVDIPDMADDSRARIAVYAEGNIFFDVSSTDIKITSNPPVPSVFVSISPLKAKLCLPEKLVIDAKSCAFGNFSGGVKLFVEKGAPVGSNITFSKTDLNATDQSNITIDMNNLTTGGNYVITIAAVTSTGDTIRNDVEVQVIKNDFSDYSLISPNNGSKGLTETPTLRWVKSINAEFYDVEIARNPAFGSSIFYSAKNIFEDSLKLPIFLNPNTIYYWRIIPKNTCTSNGTASATFSFQTLNKKCVDLPYIGNPGYINPNKTKQFEILVNESGTISDINLNKLQIDAFNVRDVKLELESPAGTRVVLFEYQCAATTLFDCSFDDEAPIDIQCPPSGKLIFRSKESLKKFNGENVNGLWKLLGTGGKNLSDAYVRNFTVEYCADVRVVQPLLITNLPLQMNPSEQKNITNTLLLTQDADSGPESIVYTIIWPVVHGILSLNGTPLTYGSSFTQKDIDENKLTYKHNGTQNMQDDFGFDVNDQTGGFISTQKFRINIGPVDIHQVDATTFTIHPNPTNSIINIQTDRNVSQDAQISIYDLHGRILRTESFGNEQTKSIDCSNIIDGIYILKIQSEGNTSQLKFTKVK